MNKDTHAMLRFRSSPFAEQSPRRGAHHRQPARLADRAAASTHRRSRPRRPSRPHRRSRPRKPSRPHKRSRRRRQRQASEAGERGRASPARWRLAACLHDRQRRHARDLPAADRRAGPIRSTSVAYAAVSYTPKGAEKPALGTVKVESDTSVALDERLVSFSELKIAEPSFPTLRAISSGPSSRRSSRR